MLSRSGQTEVEGFSAGEKGTTLPLTSRSLGQPTDRQRGGSRASLSLWERAKASSAEVFASLKGNQSHEDNEERLRELYLQGDLPSQTFLDPWVSRCRVAAIVSGMLILALCIVALVVLIRAF